MRSRPRRLNYRPPICLALFGGSIMVLLADFTRDIFDLIPLLLR